MDPWLDVFPRVKPLLVGPREVRFSDARTENWFQTFGEYDDCDLSDFIRTRLLDSNLPIAPDASDDVVTVNIRRGDYYSNEKWRGLYGFDIKTYIRRALDESSTQIPISRVDVVSDDVAWCRSELAFAGDYGKVTFQRGGDTPAQNLGQLASARRLILSNSTFSYWGAYISNVVHGENHALIWAPDLHRRDLFDGRAYQLNPRWSVISNTAVMGKQDPDNW